MNFKLFSDNKLLYQAMLADIAQAKESICLETYIFGNDDIGKQFRATLFERAQAGVKIKLLIDDFGSPVNKHFFKELTAAGGRVKFFRKVIISFRIIKHNNHRDHRKLLIIDDQISYIGSANITSHALNWRDLTLRLSDGKLQKIFHTAFDDNFKIAHRLIFKKKKHLTPLTNDGFSLIRDVPSPRFRTIRKEQLQLIKHAKKSIMIEVPYFLPDRKLVREFLRARQRGVEIVIIIPKKSDVRTIDLLREKYLGKLYLMGIKIKYYTPSILHSKLLLIDDKKFSLGSANMDYRSLILQFEICLFSGYAPLAAALKQHLTKSLSQCQDFDYRIWSKRPWRHRLAEHLLYIIRYLF